jgi:hypothetical protein
MQISADERFATRHYYTTHKPSNASSCLLAPQTLNMARFVRVEKQVNERKNLQKGYILFFYFFFQITGCL